MSKSLNKAQHLQPKKGHVHNPLLKHRNTKCPCRSGKKVKGCCGGYLYVTQYQAHEYMLWLIMVELEPGDRVQAARDFAILKGPKYKKAHKLKGASNG